MARVVLPRGFQWGAATAAYQIEGSPRADGKGESIWDRFSHTPGKVARGETGDVACDSYRRFEEDVALLRALNCTSYRFSIAWTRIQPDGSGAASSQGIDHYRRLTETLLASGIRPLPTLYHWDLPQALEDQGGWPSRDTAGRFADYTEITVRALGDLVQDWILLNEPSVFTALGYWIGLHAPGVRDADAFLRATHVANLAQARGFEAARSARSDARVGTALALAPCQPAGDEEQDAAAARRFDAFSNRWFLEPALTGEYPQAFDEGVPYARMGVEREDLQRIRAPFDFIGVNLYTRSCIRSVPDDAFGLGARPIGMGGRDGPVTDFGWEVWPRSLYDMLMQLTRDYDRPVLEVTENGCAYGDGPDADGRVRDERRIDFYRGYLEALGKAVEDGADVRGYHAWSLLDNFEWAEGYGQRFGLTHVDFGSGERRLKESGRWYARVADENGLDT